MMRFSRVLMMMVGRESFVPPPPPDVETNVEAGVVDELNPSPSAAAYEGPDAEVEVDSAKGSSNWLKYSSSESSVGAEVGYVNGPMTLTVSPGWRVVCAQSSLSMMETNEGACSEGESVRAMMFWED
jgi:hypothetical protein